MPALASGSLWKFQFLIFCCTAHGVSFSGGLINNQDSLLRKAHSPDSCQHMLTQLQESLFAKAFYQDENEEFGCRRGPQVSDVKLSVLEEHIYEGSCFESFLPGRLDFGVAKKIKQKPIKVIRR